MITPGQFNVSPTGAFTYTIPIAVPPGTAGMVPALSLDYSSQNGDGLVGLGWTLSGLPSITRCARTFAQDSIHGSVNFDANDQFCLEGQRLRPLPSSQDTIATPCSGAAGTEYRTEINGFSRIVACGTAGTGPQYFLAWTKAGQLMEFGNTTDSRPLPVLVSGGTLPSVRSWAVDKISDTVGNYLTVKYTNDETNGQLYPSEIDYTGNSGLTPYNSVRFGWDFKNPGELVPAYQAGTVMETTVILTEIDTCTNVSPTACASVSQYHLYYNYSTPTQNKGYMTQGDQHDELTSVQQCDNSGTCLAPTSFTWQGSRDTISWTRHYSGGPTPNTAFQGSDYTTQLLPGDFDGDGVLDVIPVNTTTGNCGVWLGGGDGLTFTDGQYNSQYTDYHYDGESGQWLPENEDLCSATINAQIETLDLDGDGLTDISLTLWNSAGTRQRAFFHNNGQAALIPYDENHELSAADSRFGDFDGDGRSDIFINDTTAYKYLSEGNGNWASSGSYTGNDSLASAIIPPDFDGNGCGDVMYLNTQLIALFCNAAVTTIPFPTNSGWGSNWTVTLGDFNGDGKTDVLATKTGDGNTAAKLYLSTGTGFAAPITIDAASQVPGQHDDWGQYTIYTGDFNGDGKTDIILMADGLSGHVKDKGHYIWVSTGNGFVQGKSPSGTVIGLSYTTQNYSLTHAVVRPVVADWNNDGASDVWLQQPTGDEQYLIAYTPEQIHTVTNGVGVTTTVNYDRLNKNGSFYTKSTDPSGCTGQAPSVTPNPCTQNLDGPLYVVSSVSSSNGIGGTYSSTYAYAAAKADMMGRGFLGFGSVAITDSQTNIVQTTTYHTDFPYVGLIASQTKVCPHPTCNATQDVTLNSTNNFYANARSGTANAYYYAVTLTSSVSAGFDIDAALTPLPTVETDYSTYDSYGNAKYVTVSTTPPGGSSADVVKKTTNTFTNDTTNWFLARLTAATVTTTYTPLIGSPSTITRQSGFSYDPGTGLLTEEVLEPEQSSTSNYVVTTDYQYDGFGNKTSATATGSGNPGPPACQTTTQYDTVHHQFPVTVTNCLQQSETWGTASAPAYDLRFGLPTKHTGPNNLPTSWTYDGVGREQTETRPDGTKTTLSYTYCNGVNGGVDGTCPTNGAFLATANVTGTDGSQIAPSTRAYYDALSRPLSADVQGFDGSWIRTDTIYDSWGRISRTSRPYFLVGGSPVYTTFTLDELGRVTKALQPDGHGYTTTTYDGLSTTVDVYRYGPAPSYTLLSTNITTTVKNDLGQVASVTDAGGHTTNYAYDAVGDLTLTTDPSGDYIQNWFDLRGRKTKSKDPDMGTWTYTYDSLGRLVSQTDAKHQTTNISYDQLGRMIERDEPDLTSTWTYDTATMGVGKLATASCTGTACSVGGYARTYYYDSLGRDTEVAFTTNGATHYNRTYYDAISGKITKERSFSGYFTLKTYNATGYLSQIQDYTTNFVIWQANARDAELHLLSSLSGGLLYTIQNFDADSGAVTNICASNDSGYDSHHPCDGNVANMGYAWDTAGDLADRTDTHFSWSQESFCYDKLNRLMNADFGTVCNASGRTSTQYDQLGNLNSKTFTGTYTYPTPGAGVVGPHQVSSIATSSGVTVAGVSSPNFYYDANGNMLCVTAAAQCDGTAGRSVSYTSSNMAGSIVANGTTVVLLYGPEHARNMQCTPDCSTQTVFTQYFSDDATGATAEYYKHSGSTLVWKTYIMADGKAVALRTAQGSTVTMRYFVLDHLGSVSVVTDETGATLTDGLGNETGRFSYDSWGAMRLASGAADTTCSLPQGEFNNTAPPTGTSRGFTGQEEMPSVCPLINYNARIYDPQIGRFMSADSSVEAPYDPQDLNRYTYVGNNPLAFTDPSGNCFLGCFWRQSWFKEAFSIAVIALAIIFQQEELLPELLEESTAFSGSIIGAAINGAIVFGVAGGLTGAVTTGTMQGALLGLAQGAAFGAVGGAIGAGALGTSAEVNFAGRFIASGLIGGLFSVAGGGNFASGFLSAGVGSLGGSLTGSPLDPTNLLISATVGGAASVLGGGKFLNGAISGAFAYAASSIADHSVTAERGSGDGVVGSRANIQNPGAVFDSEEAAGYDVESQMNSISIAENAEYDWAYYYDSVTGKIGYTDPYATGLIGGPHIALPLTVNGAPVADAVYFGMGHTHGNYSDQYGDVVSKSRDYYNSDNFSTGYPSDMSFMHGGGPNGTWNFFTLGTPSGRLWQWTPQNGQQPLVNQ